MSGVLILCGAFILDIIAGEPSNRFHPVAWMGSFISFFWERRLKGNNLLLFLYGTGMTLVGAVFFALVPVALFKAANMLHLPQWGLLLLGVVVLKPVFSLAKLLSVARRIEHTLEEGDIDKARDLTSRHLVSRSTDSLDEAGISAAVIESVAENLTDSFSAPLFYFSLAGFPASWMYRYINTSDAMIGYPVDDFFWGGKFAARVDDVLNYMPARLTAGVMLITAFLLGKGRTGLVSGISHEQQVTDSPNAGWTMAAAALVLGVRLEKSGYYVINPEGACPQSRDIGLTVSFIRNAALLLFLILSIFSAGITFLFQGMFHG